MTNKIIFLFFIWHCACAQISLDLIRQLRNISDPHEFFEKIRVLQDPKYGPRNERVLARSDSMHDGPRDERVLARSDSMHAPAEVKFRKLESAGGGGGQNLLSVVPASLSAGNGGSATVATRSHSCCTPRNMTVCASELWPDETSITWPICFEVQRCQGDCGNNVETCTASRVNVLFKEFWRARVAEDGSSSLVPIGVTREAIDNHVECACGCRLQQRDCHPERQVYDAQACLCRCPHMSEQRARCRPNQRWDRNLCECACAQAPRTCYEDEQFDDELCRCVVGATNTAAGLASLIDVAPANVRLPSLYTRDEDEVALPQSAVEPTARATTAHASTTRTTSTSMPPRTTTAEVLSTTQPVEHSSPESTVPQRFRCPLRIRCRLGFEVRYSRGRCRCIRSRLRLFPESQTLPPTPPSTLPHNPASQLKKWDIRFRNPYSEQDRPLFP